MAQRSNKSKAKVSTTTLSPIAKMTTTTYASSLSSSNDNVDLLLKRKISLATEGFTTDKFCEHVLRDRGRLSKENALTICEYIIAMKREINPRLSHKEIQYSFCRSYQRLSGSQKSLST
jgi:hypothetical protein